ncbi:MAG: hypothetical protein M1834_009306 [Cirrosporium novae-zelandiae]|nr:MAG: hypothetical protein M1834_009306 [Cirrosporium novae-zelandiae]
MSVNTADMELAASGRISQALSHLLSTQKAKVVLAQVIDGLPTIESAKRHNIEHLPDIENRVDPSQDGINSAKKFLSSLSPEQLSIQPQLAEAYQNSERGSQEEKIRFLECVTFLFHIIVVALHFQTFPESQMTQDKWPRRRPSLPPDPPLRHIGYYRGRFFPQGKGEVVSYWAESELFGGVIVFERGESGQEACSAWVNDPTRTTIELSNDQLDLFFALGDENPSNSSGKELVANDFLPFKPAPRAVKLDLWKKYERKIYRYYWDIHEPHWAPPRDCFPDDGDVAQLIKQMDALKRGVNVD